MPVTINAMPDSAILRAANVNPTSGLASDYLNVFNEYIMLAELVADGSMDADILNEWEPIDYESHFVQSGFTGVKIVLAAFRALDESAHTLFEDEVNKLIDLILSHQNSPQAAALLLAEIQSQRDVVATLISGDAPTADAAGEATQATIDALFD